jgi:hypothetical protein
LATALVMELSTETQKIASLKETQSYSDLKKRTCCKQGNVKKAKFSPLMRMVSTVGMKKVPSNFETTLL